jgi:hypothetical protein
MRWSVEVTRVGTSEVLDELCLEAAHWQQALKRAREIRGEGASLEGLSVDALDEGCRAIDAASALRFEVTRVADDAPLIESSSQGSRPASKDEASEDSAGPGFASRRSIDRSSSRRSIGEAKASTAGTARDDAATRPSTTGVSRVAARPATSPVAARPSMAFGAKAKAAPLARMSDAEAPNTPPAGTQVRAARAAAGDEVRADETAAAIPNEDARYELVSSRTSPSTPRMPVAHHERSFGLKATMSTRELETFLTERLADLRAELVGARAGNVIDLAVFPEVFEGRPSAPPLMTLRWCDWRENREIAVDPYGAHEESFADAAPAPVEPAARPAPTKKEAPVEARRPLPSKPVPEPAAEPEEDVPAATPAAEETQRKKVLPKALPKAAPRTASEMPPPGGRAATASTVPKEPVKPAPKAPEEADANAGKQLTAKRPLGVRAPLGARPSTAGAAARPGPVAGSKPAGATRVAGGQDIKPTVAGTTSSGRTSSTSEDDADGSDDDDGPASSRADQERLSRRSILTFDEAPRASQPGSCRVVSASAGGFERTAAVSSRSAPSPEGRALSREEKEARHQSARARASTVPPPGVRAGKRVSGDQLLADLFELMSELHYLSDALEGAAHVLAVALEKLPSDVGMVSLFDLDRREYVVVRQTGGKRSALLLRGPETAPITAQAMRTKKPALVSDGFELPDSLDVRWQETGVDPQSYLCGPVEMAGRTLGLVELLNPRDGRDFEAGDANALGYICSQYAEFLDKHGVMLDPDAILVASDVGARR